MALTDLLTSPLAIALVTGTVALVGALGSQVINARTTLKSKRIELAYTRKVEAYQAFLVEAAHFAHDSQGEEKYRVYLRSLMAAELVASRDVLEALQGAEGVNNPIQQIRASQFTGTYNDREAIINGPFSQAMERLRDAMRHDLKKFTSI